VRAVFAGRLLLAFYSQDILRGVAFSLLQISVRSRSVIDSGSTSLDSHFLARLLVFSTVPFCQGDCGSQNMG